jgi:phosphonate transport system substrate-binding protein
VANKQVDVATNNNENMARLLKTQPAKAKDIKVIWQSPVIPSDPLVWRTDLDATTKAKVREFFLAYGKNSERELNILKTIGFGGFKPSSNAQLIPIRQLELARERSRIEADTAMSPADKAKKLQEIDGKLAELGRQVASAN